MRLALVALAVGAFGTAPAAAQSIWIVDALGGAGSHFTTIQAAIDAGTTLAGDTVEVRPGTYLENVDYRGKGLRVRSTDGATVTTIDAQGSGIVVTFASGEGPGARLEGFTLTGGDGIFHPASGNDVGGGIYCLRTAPTIAACVVTTNGTFSSSGAGLFAEAASPRILDCEFTQNFSQGWGGGMTLLSCSTTVSGCSFLGNTAQTADGGAIYAAGGSLVIADTTFTDNLAADGGYGGGLSALDCNVSIGHCTFLLNRSDIDHKGGGIYFEAGFLDVGSTSLIGNFAAQGGGAYVQSGTARFGSCSFLDNEAHVFQALTGQGGGLFASAGATVTASFCVFAGNLAIDEATGASQGGGVWGAATLANCTLVGNDADVVLAGGGAFGSSLVNCIVWDNLPDNLAAATASYSDVQGGWPGTGNLDVDPDFWNPGTRDFHLKPGSGCIDAGDPSGPRDPDGTPPDMGAFRFHATYCPTPTTFCTAKSTSCGTFPAIGYSGAPSAALPSGFVIAAAGTPALKCGLLLYTNNGKGNAPFHGAILCLSTTPLRRTVAVCDASGTPGACDGTLAIDMNAFAAGQLGGNPLAALSMPGEQIDCQFWGRDTPGNSSLSDALEYSVCP